MRFQWLQMTRFISVYPFKAFVELSAWVLSSPALDKHSNITVVLVVIEIMHMKS